MIEEFIGQFSPESFGEWCREKFDRFTADPHEAPNAGEFPKARIVGYVQSLPDSDINRPLLVMSVYAGEQISERSSRRRQFDFARKQLQAAIDKPPAKVKGLFTQGLFAFHDSAGNFRLSLVSARAEGKKLVYSDFKRQSFFVRPGLNNKTFRARMASAFGTYGDLTAAFSVETLTKEFYNSLFAWYERAMAPESKVTFPNDLTRDDDDRTQLAEHLIRLITRLMFIWFIRQKDLIPEKIFDPAALKALLKSFDPASPKQDNYYRAILQNLFFATLNCEIKDRKFANEGDDEEGRKEHYGIKLLYRYYEEFAYTKGEVKDLFLRVPFLNGGLFECLDRKKGSNARSPVIYQDGFSRNPKRVAHIPNNLFFDERGLITLFSRYDFTVDENDPNDSDVALDPELLGKVFENLLGAYNPETRETARKQSGSFYTPREIVNYMVDESLVAHLRTQAPEVEEPVVRQYLGGEEPPDLPNPLRRKLVTALYHCRILDPACGSGAFPMGLLLKMVHLLQRLDPKNTLWHEVVMAEAEKALAEAESLGKEEKEQRRRRITESFDRDINHSDYARKLYLIENCIFGVDIQPIAVQIAKLRAFITLVCDQTPDLEDADRNYRMLPLPNLETKFVAANTLIGLKADFAEGLKTSDGGSRLDDPELERLRRELDETRHRHFRARSAPEKNECRRLDEELRGKIKNRLVEIACKPDAAKIAFYRAEIEKLNAKRKAVEREEWKEVVQSRPQQGNLFDSAPAPVQTVMRVDVNKEARDRLDDDLRRNSRAIEAEEGRAKNKSAFQHEADRLADWDPYNQNASSPFFDPEWMFGFKGGFDIVIGNPPYVRQEAIKDQKTTLKAQGFASFDGTADIFVYFYERGITLLKECGHLCYITSNKYLRSGYGENLRTFLAGETRVLQLIDFGDAPVFDAIAYPSIFLACRGKPEPNHQLIAFVWSPGPSISDFPLLFRRHSFTLSQASLRSDGWQLQSPAVISLLNKLRASGTLLGEYVGGKFFRGILTGLNDAFVVDRATRDRLIAEYQSSAKLLKPFLRGRDVKRWRSQFAEQYLIKIESSENKKHPWSGMSSAKAEAVFKQTYPAIHKFMNQFRAALINRTDQGKYFWELRSCKYWEAFDQCKITYPNICRRNEFAWDEDGFLTNQKAFIIPSSDKYLLSVLNSSVVRFLFEKCVARLQNEYFEPSAIFMEKFPIPSATLEQQMALSNLVDRILAAAKVGQAFLPAQNTQTGMSAPPSSSISNLEAEIDRLVYGLYGLTEDEIAIVEGRGASEKKTAVAAKSAKAANGRQPRKSVMSDDPDLE